MVAPPLPVAAGVSFVRVRNYPTAEEKKHRALVLDLLHHYQPPTHSSNLFVQGRYVGLNHRPISATIVHEGKTSVGTQTDPEPHLERSQDPIRKRKVSIGIQTDPDPLLERSRELEREKVLLERKNQLLERRLSHFRHVLNDERLRAQLFHVLKVADSNPETLRNVVKKRKIE